MLPQDFSTDDLMSELMGNDFNAQLKARRDRMVQSAQSRDKDVARVADLAQEVLGTASGRELLTALAALTYLRPSFPPPQGIDAGIYAAHVEGQKDIVAMMINWTRKD